MYNEENYLPPASRGARAVLVVLVVVLVGGGRGGALLGDVLSCINDT